ncbi:hypothetical protein KBY29_09615 [Ruegeria pomeroyi]|nr:hypothetical protein [Ruegeria pomeroyi]
MTNAANTGSEPKAVTVSSSQRCPEARFLLAAEKFALILFLPTDAMRSLFDTEVAFQNGSSPSS